MHLDSMSPLRASDDGDSPREEFGTLGHERTQCGSNADIRRLNFLPSGTISASNGSLRLSQAPMSHEGSAAAYSAAFEGARFQMGRVASKPPDLIHDLVFYLRNNHMLLAAFTAHSSHPYGVQRRRLLLLNSVGFAFFITCLAQSLGGGCTASSECVSNRRNREQLREVIGAPVVALLRDFPTTLSVLLQLLWDVPQASMGICHCAKHGPCRKQCGRGMLACFICNLLGVVYAIAATTLLFIFAKVLGIVEVSDVMLLLLMSKALAFLYAIPMSAAIFALLWRAEVISGDINGHDLI